MPITILRSVSIVLVALAMGLAFAHVLEQPAKMQYDALLYLTLQQSLYVQWGPPHIGGWLEPLAVAATALLAFFTRKDARELGFSLAALLALVLAFPVVFFWLVAPANAGFAAALLPAIPDNFTELRANWETGHAIRFALQFAGLALLVLPLTGRVATASGPHPALTLNRANHTPFTTLPSPDALAFDEQKPLAPAAAFATGPVGTVQRSPDRRRSPRQQGPLPTLTRLHVP